MHTIKRAADGSVQKCKARWVLRGQDKQKWDRQTDSPTCTRRFFLPLLRSLYCCLIFAARATNCSTSATVYIPLESTATMRSCTARYFVSPSATLRGPGSHKSRLFRLVPGSRLPTKIVKAAISSASLRSEGRPACRVTWSYTLFASVQVTHLDVIRRCLPFAGNETRNENLGKHRA